MQTQTFNISIPRELVTQMDKVAKLEYRNRSELIKEAIRVYLEDRKRWDDIYGYGEKQSKKLNLKSEEEVNQIVKLYRKGK